MDGSLYIYELKLILFLEDHFESGKGTTSYKILRIFRVPQSDSNNCGHCF